MRALLKGGPADGQEHGVGDSPPRRGYLMVGQGTFGAEVHRYDLSDVNADPNAAEPRASYAYGGKLPDDA